MGQNFALNMASHESKAYVSNQCPAKVDIIVPNMSTERNVNDDVNMMMSLLCDS
jgi:6-phosphogluconate dehydrogenase